MAEELGAIKWRIDVDTTDLGRAESAMDKTGEVADRSSKRVVDSSKKIEKGYKDVGTAANLALKAVTALAAGISVQQAVKYADAWKQVNNQLRQVTTGESQLRAVRAQMLGISRSTNAELGNTVNLYSELFRATRDLGTSQQTVAGVTKTINNLFKAGGKSAAETAGAVRQLAQGLASGALRGDEFNSVAEGAPRILDALAKHLKVSRGELREMAAEGKITAEIMVDALAAYSDEAQRMADMTEETFGQKMVNAKTNVTEFVGGLESATGVVGILGEGVEGLTEHLDTAASVATVLALVVGGRMASSALAAGSSFIYATTQAMAYQAALARMAGVSVTAAAAQTGLSRALMAVGGPTGLALLAAGGIALLVQQQKASADAAWEQARAFEEVQARLGSMTQQELVAHAMSLNNDIEMQKRRVSGYEALNESTGDYAAQLSKARLELVDLESRQAAVINQLRRLQGASGEATDSVKEWSAAERESVTAIAIKRAQLAMSGREAAIFNAVWDEYAKGTAPEVIAVIAEQTGLLYDQEQQAKATKTAAEKLAEDQAKLNQRVDETIFGLASSQAQLHMTGREQAIYNEMVKLGSDASAEQQRRVAAAAGALYDQRTAFETAAAAAKSWDDMLEKGAEQAQKTAAEVARAQQEAMEKSAQATERFRDSFSDSIRDIGLRNKDVVETIEDAWKGLGWKIMGDLAASGFLALMSGKGGSFSLQNTLSGAGVSGDIVTTLLGKLAPSLLNGGTQGLTEEAYVAMMQGKMSPTGNTGKSLMVTDLVNIAKTVGAGIAGGFIGNEVGESLFGKTANSSWGATAGGLIGAVGGPMGAFIGSALGSMIDAAFGGDGKKRANAGFLASPTPGLKDEYNAGDHTFASGLRVTLFARRTDPSAARDILNVFDQVDRSFVDLVKELGGQVSVSAMQGLDEEASPGSFGNFFGTGGNGTTQGDIAAQLSSYIQQLTDNTTGLDEALLDTIRSASSAEEALTLLTQAVAKKAEVDEQEQITAAESARVLNERMRLQEEYDDLTLTSAEKLQRQRDALDESNRALFDNIQALKEARRAEEERVAAFEMALGAARNFLDNIRDEQADLIRDRYSALMDAERELHNRRFNLLRSLMDLTSDLRLGSLTTLNRREQLTFAQDRFRELASTALNTGLSMEDRVTAAEELKQVADQYLTAGRGMYASSGEYKSIFDEVMQALEGAKFLGTNKEFNPSAIENAMLEELKKLNQGVGILPPGIAAALAPLMNSLIAQAILAGKSATTTANIISGMGLDAVKVADPLFTAGYGTTIGEAATTAEEAVAALAQINAVASSEKEAVDMAVALAKESGLSVAQLTAMGVTTAGGESLESVLARYGIPTFADGGRHGGGWRIVGEEGPELEYTGSSQIFDHQTSKAMLAGDSSAEIRALIEEVRELKRLMERQNGLALNGAEYGGRQMTHQTQVLERIERKLVGSGEGGRKYATR